MTTISQQKWVFCLQIEEVRESEREELAGAFRETVQPFAAISVDDPSTYIECERAHVDAWDMRCCVEAWFDVAVIPTLPALITHALIETYRGPATNIRAWDGPALRSPAFGVPPAAQHRDIER